MSELQYSILRYTPSLVSGEKINLAAVFYYPDTSFREFFSISNWKRVSSFDDSLCIPMLKDILLDMKDEVGTSLINPRFSMKQFCAQYTGELHFDNFESLKDVGALDIDAQIENIKHMYFQFEYEIDSRPKYEDQKRFLTRLLKSKQIDFQKRFLTRLLKSKQIDYTKNVSQLGKFNESIVYDYIFDRYGVKFFNLNINKIDNKTINVAKAWAWNCRNLSNDLNIIILYNLDDETRLDAKPVVDILKDSAYKTCI